jgi:hypothetical protein
MEYYNKIVEITDGEKPSIYFQVEHAGYGAILSRLMTGLNLAVSSNFGFYFDIMSNYVFEQLFDIVPKRKTRPEQVAVWNFWQHTWNAPEQVRNSHQFPSCPLIGGDKLTKHQYCSVLAYAICGHPKPVLKDKINSVMTKLNWDQFNIHIGLHVRRGDKTVEVPYIPTEKYLEYVNEIIEKNPYDTIGIYLTSDDPTSYEEYSSKIKNHRVKILWDEEEVRYNNYNAGMVSQNTEVAYQESITAAKNILLLGHCDYVIGMRTAQFTWIGGLLCVFNHNLDTNRHIMIDAKTLKRGCWGDCYTSV